MLRSNIDNIMALLDKCILLAHRDECFDAVTHTDGTPRKDSYAWFFSA